MKKLFAVLVASTFALCACSTVMEANRPPPTNLAKFAVGDKRIDVISRIGSPTSTEKDGEKSCDVYSLYTRGLGKAGKGAIIVGEAAADIFTAGLFEAVATPAEAVTKNKKHTVLFCYSPEGTLASVSDEGKQVLPAVAKAAAAPTTEAAKGASQ